jgi:hypothetical protein
VAIEECTASISPSRPEDYTAEPFRAQGCIDMPEGQVIIVRFVGIPGSDLGGRDNRECLAMFSGGGLRSVQCYDEDASRAFAGGSPTRRYALATAILVPEGTTRVVAVTTRGVEITFVPYERMAFLSWPTEAGELLTLTAETAQTAVDLLSD